LNTPKALIMQATVVSCWVGRRGTSTTGWLHWHTERWCSI